MSLRTSLFALCLLSLAGIAHAGAVYRVTTEIFAEGNQFYDAPESSINVTKVEGNRMRSDTQNFEGETKSSVIFLGETDEMYMIDHEEKMYIVMDKESVEAMANQMGEAMKQMQEAMAGIPPEQRAMMEKMMMGKMGGNPDYKPPSPPVVTSLGQNGNVNGITCEWKQVTRDDVLEEKACVCDENEIAGGQEMVALAYEMKDFADGLMQLANSVSNMPMLGSGGQSVGDFAMTMTRDLEGFSLISEHYDGEGKLMRRSTFESADEIAVADEEFVPPSGYKKQTFADLAHR